VEKIMTNPIKRLAVSLVLKTHSAAKQALKPFIPEPSHEQQVARAREGTRRGALIQAEHFSQSDVIWVRFPKSGSTWLEVMLTKYFFERYQLDSIHVRDLHPITRSMPSLATIVRTHDDDIHLKPVEQFETDKSKYRDKGVLFLARDPRDLLVSYFFEYTKKKEYLAAGEPPYTGTIDDFVHHHIGGLRTIVRFYNIWAENVTVPREFHLLTYENLQADTRGELARVLKLLDKSEIDTDCLDKAIAFGGFDNMRQLEERSAPGLTLNPHVKLGDTEGYKVRKGKVGGYVEYLSPASVATCDRIIDEELSDYFGFYKHQSPVAN
jgi:hypothetical protein